MKTLDRVYLYGAGCHAQVIYDILAGCGVSVAGVFDDNPADAKLRLMDVQDGIRRLGPRFPRLDAPVIIAVGDNGRRATLATALGATYGLAIHDSANVDSSVSIGAGTMVLQGAVLQAGTSIGQHVVVNTAASIDHDNVIGDFAHVSPHATLCGHVELGEGTHVGAGAVVIQEIKIGRWCTIGAGAVVLRDVPDYATAVGNPAKVIKIDNELPEMVLAG